MPGLCVTVFRQEHHARGLRGQNAVCRTAFCRRADRGRGHGGCAPTWVVVGLWMALWLGPCWFLAGSLLVPCWVLAGSWLGPGWVPSAIRGICVEAGRSVGRRRTTESRGRNKADKPKHKSRELRLLGPSCNF